MRGDGRVTERERASARAPSVGVCFPFSASLVRPPTGRHTRALTPQPRAAIACCCCLLHRRGRGQKWAGPGVRRRGEDKFHSLT